MPLQFGRYELSHGGRVHSDVVDGFRDPPVDRLWAAEEQGELARRDNQRTGADG